MKKIILIFGATAVLLVTARATSIVFDTFGPSDTYATSLGFDVGDPGGGISNVQEAAQFTAGVSGNLATIDLGLTYVTGFSAIAVDAYLAAAGGAPGSEFNPANETFLGSGTPTGVFGSTNNSLVSFSVSGTVPVTIGSTYWLVLKPATSGGLDVWNEESSGVAGTTDETYNGLPLVATYPFLPAFRLTASSGSSVPDSGSTILLMLGALAPLVVLQRKLIRRQAIQ